MLLCANGRLVKLWVRQCRVVGSNPLRRTIVHFYGGLQGPTYYNWVHFSVHLAASVAQLAGIAGIAGLVAQHMKCSNPSLLQFQVLGTPKKILTRCPVRWSRWTSTQFRLGYAGRSLLGFGPRVARVLNYASCTLVRDTEGYIAAPSLRDYL